MNVYRLEKCIHNWRPHYGGLECVKCKEYTYKPDDPVLLRKEEFKEALIKAENKGGRRAVVKLMIKEMIESGNYNLQSYVVFDKADQWQSASLGAPCLAGLHSLPNKLGNTKNFVVMWDWCFGEPKKRAPHCEFRGKKWAETWFDFLANESVYAPAFITKTWKEASSNGIFYDLTQKARMVMSAACAVRYIYEDECVPKSWYKFVSKKKLDKNVALAFAHYYYLRDDGKQVGIADTLMGHCMIDTDGTSAGQLKGLVTHKIDNNVNRRAMNDGWEWRGLNTLFGADKGESYEHQGGEIMDTGKRDAFNCPIMRKSPATYTTILAKFKEDLGL